MIEMSKITTGCREDGAAETICRRLAAFPRELQPEQRNGFDAGFRFSRVRRVTPLKVESALLGEVWVVPRKYGLSSLVGMEGFFLLPFCGQTQNHIVIYLKEIDHI